ncbi:MAG: DUF294 nucleotidyltransferase-like domain-containing protein [Oceanococcaceae bacterium]
MHAEQIEIQAFLGQRPPFAELPEEELRDLAGQVEVSYFKAGEQILELGAEAHSWYVIRSGSVEIYRHDGELHNRLSEGGHFGEFALLRGRRVRFPAKALEDTLLYAIPATLFTQLYDQHEAFADRVEIESNARLRHAVAQKASANELLTATIDTLVGHAPLTLPLSATARDAALRMQEETASSVLVMDATGKMVGILTDRDLRNRLIAEGRAFDTPIGDIMTTDPVQVGHKQRVYEAMLLMLRHNVHHLPVLKRGQPTGVVALSDVIRYESQNSLFVVRSIFDAQSVDELVELRSAVRASFIRMVNEDANSRMIGGAMAVIGRSFKQRLLELGEAQLGPPPVPYCFLALGSMAREEQLIVTDQDNAMVLDDRFDPQQHDGYFQALAKIVCDGLDACGYTYCKGDIMATNTQWRQPLRVWKTYFSDWIDKPSPAFLLNSSIFFDLTDVRGQPALAAELSDLIRHKSQHNSRFLACLARTALLRTPPLGFFRDFVLESDGKHSNTINMKRRGTAPVADLLRTHALAVGSPALNSFERLTDIIDAEILPRGRGEDLRDALELISMVRIRHQALALQAGNEPNNNVAPENLSEFERKNLKDAFQVLANAQSFLKYRYQPGRVS